MWYNI